MRELITEHSELIIGGLTAGLVIALFLSLVQDGGALGRAMEMFAAGIC